MNRFSLLVCALPFIAWGTIQAGEIDKLIPNDSDVVLCIRIDALLQTDLGKNHLRPNFEQLLKDRPHTQEFLRSANLDPLRDIRRVTIAMSGNSQNHALVIVSGRFDPEKIETVFAKAAADAPDRVKTHPVGKAFIHEIIGDEQQVSFAAVIDPATLVFAPKIEPVKAALAGKEVGRLKPALIALLPPAPEPTAWLAALPGIATGLPTEDAELKKALEGLEGIQLNVHFDANLSLVLNLRSKSTEANTALADKMRALLVFLNQGAATLVKDQAELGAVLRNLKLVTAPMSMSVKSEISGASLEKLIDQARKGKP